MALLIVSGKGNGHKWKDQLTKLNPDLDIRVYPEDKNRDDVEFALAWNPPMGIFRQYPNLKCIASTGAGVDHILKDPELPVNVRITRVVDHRLTKDMSDYLLTYVMAYVRSSDVYIEQQQNRVWLQHAYKVPEKTTIGIMGLGELGEDIALKLIDLGFPVKGWSKTMKQASIIKAYAGEAQLKDFLDEVKVLICLLPLTGDTRNILSKELFDLLPKGAYIINVARGEHLVEQDLLDALASGQLTGACLDVFRKEPLPQDHPFWANNKITITPHVASITSMRNVAPQILENYRRMTAGQSLLNEVSREKGY